VLSVKQPWAGLLVAGVKDVENRTWVTLYRGRILIHASRRPDRSLIATWPRQPDLNRTLGAIIGSVELVDIVRAHSSRWAEPNAWNWIVRDPIVFAEPVLISGHLGLWTPTGHDQTRIVKATTCASL